MPVDRITDRMMAAYDRMRGSPEYDDEVPSEASGYEDHDEDDQGGPEYDDEAGLEESTPHVSHTDLW